MVPIGAAGAGTGKQPRYGLLWDLHDHGRQHFSRQSDGKLLADVHKRGHQHAKSCVLSGGMEPLILPASWECILQTEPTAHRWRFTHTSIKQAETLAVSKRPVFLALRGILHRKRRLMENCFFHLPLSRRWGLCYNIIHIIAFSKLMKYLRFYADLECLLYYKFSTWMK